MDNRRAYVYQAISPHMRLRQYVRSPFLKIRDDTRLYVPFAQHFYMDVVYITTRKYLANRKEKKLIRMYQSKPF